MPPTWPDALTLTSPWEGTLRPARLSDANVLYRWTNDLALRQHSARRDPIPAREFLAWLEFRLRDAATRWAIVEVWHGGGSVGMIRFQQIPDEPVVRITLFVAYPFRRRGFGQAMLSLAPGWIADAFPECSLAADVYADNLPSTQLFRSQGFLEHHDPFTRARSPHRPLLRFTRPLIRLEQKLSAAQGGPIQCAGGIGARQSSLSIRQS